MSDLESADYPPVPGNRSDCEQSESAPLETGAFDLSDPSVNFAYSVIACAAAVVLAWWAFGVFWYNREAWDIPATELNIARAKIWFGIGCSTGCGIAGLYFGAMHFRTVIDNHWLKGIACGVLVFFMFIDAVVLFGTASATINGIRSGWFNLVP